MSRILQEFSSANETYSFNMCDPFRLYLLYDFYITSNYYRSCFFKTVFTTIPIPICWADTDPTGLLENTCGHHLKTCRF